MASDQFGYITLQSRAHVNTVRLRGSRIILPASLMSTSKWLRSMELKCRIPVHQEQVFSNVGKDDRGNCHCGSIGTGEKHLGECKYSSTHSWPRQQIEVGSQLHVPAALLTAKSSAGLDALEEGIAPLCWEMNPNPSVVQPKLTRPYPQILNTLYDKTASTRSFLQSRWRMRWADRHPRP
jgi:hypothetical protein